MGNTQISNTQVPRDVIKNVLAPFLPEEAQQAVIHAACHKT
jgi:hypothetical protein